MSKQEILSEIQKICGTQFGQPKENFKLDTDLFYTYRLDSLDLAEIFVGITYKLHLRFTQQEEDIFYSRFSESSTIQTLVDTIYEKQTLGTIASTKTKQNELSNKSVSELIAIIEQQRLEIAKLKNQKIK